MMPLRALRRQQHRIYDVDHAVRRLDVGLNYVGIVDHDAHGSVHAKLLPFGGGNVQGLAANVGGQYAAGHDVIFQYCCELGLVLK